VLWGAGITAAPLARTLGLALDKGDRIRTDERLHPLADEAQPTRHAEVFVCGDIAAVATACNGGEPVPGVAPAAIQMGAHAARQIVRALRDKPEEPYRYFDKGQLATIGRAAAVAALGKWHFSGLLAWLLWVVVHILYLASFRNRVVVLFEWAWAWLSWSRPSRIILEKGARWPPPPDAPAPPPGA
jgi:NADH dehydrogenase